MSYVEGINLLDKNQSIDVLFWADLQSFEAEEVQEDRDLMGKSIWENYLSPNAHIRPKVSQECAERLSKVLQSPFPKNMFDEAKMELLKTFSQDPFVVFLKNATIASLYRYREGKRVDFPREVVEAFVKEILEGNDWKEVKRKEAVKMFQKSYPGFSNLAQKHLISLDQPPDVVAQLLLAPKKKDQKSSSSRTVLEKLSAQTSIVHTKYKRTFSKMELIHLTSLSHLSDGTLVILCRSIDYPSIPITRKYQRGCIVFGGYIFQKTPEGTLLSTIAFMEGPKIFSVGRWIKQALKDLNTNNLIVKQYLQNSAVKQ